MPELPEVETIRRGVQRRCAGATVVAASVHRAGFVRGPRDDASLLVGETIARAHRHGKQFALETTGGRSLIFHMGMSGSLSFHEPGARRATHVHVHWVLRRRGRLFELHHRDPRRFGSLVTGLTWSRVTSDAWRGLGPDALVISVADLARALRQRTACVKSVLLDQAVIAGVGNIYADEALFRSGIHPLRPACDIKDAEVERLAQSIRMILKEAIESGGSTVRDYLNTLGKKGGYQHDHLVYGRGSLPCVCCGTSLERIVCQQRTTVFCRLCQPRKPTRRTKTP